VAGRAVQQAIVVVEVEADKPALKSERIPDDRTGYTAKPASRLTDPDGT